MKYLRSCFGRRQISSIDSEGKETNRTHTRNGNYTENGKESRVLGSQDFPEFFSKQIPKTLKI